MPTRSRLPMTNAEAADRLAMTPAGVRMLEYRGKICRYAIAPRLGYDPLDIERIRQAHIAASGTPHIAGHWTERR